ncbi:MAG TPA: hypothetical protein VKS60_16420 [Stellaceae bacterium]|nr:hypothetical protein [Stellaceae bacterium]
MADRHLAMLRRLQEMGMALAEAVHKSGVEAEEPEVKAQAALAFSRVARTVRDAMALEAALAGAARDDARKVATSDWIGGTMRRTARCARRRRKVHTGVMHAALFADPTKTERHHHQKLLDQLRETLKNDEFEPVLDSRPIGDIVAVLCKRFGIPFDRELFAGQDWMIDDEESAFDAELRALAEEDDAEDDAADPEDDAADPEDDAAPEARPPP